MPKRTDANQSVIMTNLRKVGCEVQDLHIIGHGCPDILTSHPQANPSSQNWLFEIKSDGGKLTEDEIKWHRRWPGQKAIIHCFEDAARIMGLW